MANNKDTDEIEKSKFKFIRNKLEEILTPGHILNNKYEEQNFYAHRQNLLRKKKKKDEDQK